MRDQSNVCIDRYAGLVVREESDQVWLIEHCVECYIIICVESPGCEDS